MKTNYWFFEHENDNNKVAYLLAFPYTSSKDEKLIKSMKNSLITRVTNSGTRLSKYIKKKKDKLVKEQEHDIVYHDVKCLENQFSTNYTQEAEQRLNERVLNHNGRDANCHLERHVLEKKL